MGNLLELGRNRDITYNSPGGRITNRLFSNFSEQFCLLLNKSLDILSETNKRFTEIQAYGLITQSLLNLGDDSPPFVLTEHPVKRCNGGYGSVDFLFTVRDQAYAVEVKLVYVGIQQSKDDLSKLKMAWYGKDKAGDLVGVAAQLESMRFEKSIENKLTQNYRGLLPRKFPLLIVNYSRNHSNYEKDEISEDLENTLKSRHEEVWRTLSENASCKKHAPFMDSLFLLDGGLSYGIRSDKRSVSVLGVGLFGGSESFENELL